MLALRFYSYFSFSGGEGNSNNIVQVALLLALSFSGQEDLRPAFSLGLDRSNGGSYRYSVSVHSQPRHHMPALSNRRNKEAYRASKDMVVYIAAHAPPVNQPAATTSGLKQLFTNGHHRSKSISIYTTPYFEQSWLRYSYSKVHAANLSSHPVVRRREHRPDQRFDISHVPLHRLEARQEQLPKPSARSQEWCQERRSTNTTRDYCGVEQGSTNRTRQQTCIEFSLSSPVLSRRSEEVAIISIGLGISFGTLRTAGATTSKEGLRCWSSMGQD